MLAAIAAGAGQPVLAIAFALLAAALAVSSRHALRLAARSWVGAESEAQVRRALEPLRREGWRVQHSLDWPGGGDLDHVVRAPSGIGFVIETKTLRYTRAHRAHTAAAARRLARRRRRYRRGVRPVICLTRARGVERIEGGVLVVSLEAADYLRSGLTTGDGTACGPSDSRCSRLCRPRNTYPSATHSS